MRTFDLAPFYRSTIGFDRLGSLLDTLTSFDGEAPSYPPYNIERVGENEYRISMAVAGFGESDLTIEVKENTLSIRGEKRNEGGSSHRSSIHQRRFACGRGCSESARNCTSNLDPLAYAVNGLRCG